MWAEGGNFKNGLIKNADAKEVYVVWLSTPPAEREPRTLRALAAELEVTETTLHNWKRQSEVVDRVHANSMQLLKIERVSAIMDSLSACQDANSRSRSVVPAPAEATISARHISGWAMAKLMVTVPPMDSPPT